MRDELTSMEYNQVKDLMDYPKVANRLGVNGALRPNMGSVVK